MDFASQHYFAPVRAAVAILLLLAAGCGSITIVSVLVSRVAGKMPLTPKSLMIQLPAGMVLIGWLAVISDLLISPPRYAILRALGFFAVCGLWRMVLADRNSVVRAIPRRSWTPVAIASSCVGFIAGLVTLGQALCLPTGWDELVYHITLPSRWHEAGHLAVFDDLPYSGLPSLLEILLWTVAGIEPLVTGKLLTWVFGVIGWITLYRLLRPECGVGVSSVVTLSLALSPAALLLVSNCYVEAMQLSLMAALIYLMKVTRFQTLRVAAGILCGGIIACKITGVGCLALPIASLGVQALQRESSVKRSAWSALIILAATVAVAFPFYLRPWLATGNPLHPFFWNWFDGPPAVLEMSRFHHAIADGAFGYRGIDGFILGPVLVAFHEDLYDGWYGWQFLGLLAIAVTGPILWNRETQRSHVLPLSIACGAAYAVWFFSAQQVRFAILFAVLCAAVAAHSVAGMSKLLRRITAAILLATTVLSLPVRTAGYYVGSWETLAGQFTWEQYVADGASIYFPDASKAVEKHVPAGETVLLLFEQRTLYFTRPTVIVTPFFQHHGFTPPENFSTAAAIMSVFDRNGSRFLLLAREPQGPDRDAEWWSRVGSVFAGLAECRERQQLTVVWESELYVLVEIFRQTEKVEAERESSASQSF